MTAREPIATDKPLLAQAQRIPLRPPRNQAVFYHGDEGARRSILFVRQHPGHVRIDELLQRTSDGRDLLAVLGDRPWAQKEEVWWELSRSLARAAAGDVHCFGPERLTRAQPLVTHRSQFVPGAFANTVFEKVELPELWNNPQVETIYYNGSPFK